MNMIKALIVEDSKVVQDFLAYLLSEDPEIRVIGTAHNGNEAIEFIQRHKPDVVTMDIFMPHMDGITTIRKIMESHPLPIVVVSQFWRPDEREMIDRSIEAGAMAGVQLPHGIGHPNFHASSRELIQTVKLMAEMKVVKRRRTDNAIQLKERLETGKSTQFDINLVAIGASTGGPLALQTIFSMLSKDFQTPIVAVQHIAEGFTEELVRLLGQVSSLDVQIAKNQERILQGRAYLAPYGFQMKVDRSRVLLSMSDEPEHAQKPSVSYLFRSVAESFGPQAVGVLLSGMGSDGAAELKLMRDKGAITIAQDKASSVVYGMPYEAVKLKGATYVASPNKIVTLLENITKKNRK
jgi:two-component system chemotaxis response regulator CheB